MKRSRRKKSLTLSNFRWRAYAAAGAASTLGGAHWAKTEIHYPGVIERPLDSSDKRFPLGHSARLFLDRHTYNWDFSVSGAAVSNDLCEYITNRYGLTFSTSILP